MSDVKGKTGAVLRETAVLTGAVAIIAASVFFFLVPSHTSVSSISGLGIVLSNFVPLPLSVITMILNVVLLIIGFFTCGREFGAKTVYTSVLLPVFLGLFEKLFPEFGSMTGSQELDVLCYILVVSIGLSILFNRNASSGGLDIVAKIMNKYLHMELGKAMSLSGMCVALSAALVYDKKTVVLSILGTYFNGIVLDHFIFDNSIKRRVCIITEKEEALRQFILHDLHSGATMYEAIGAYNLEKHNEIITIVDKSELYQPGRPQGFCYRLQCVQHAVSAQDLIGGELRGILKPGKIKAHGGKKHADLYLCFRGNVCPDGKTKAGAAARAGRHCKGDPCQHLLQRPAH